MTGKEYFFVYLLSCGGLWLVGGFDPLAAGAVDLLAKAPSAELVLRTKAGLMFVWGFCGLLAVGALIFAPNRTFME